MERAVIVSALRSPLARAGKGSFKDLRIDDIAAVVMKESIARIKGLDPELIEDVMLGCAMPEGEQGLNIARNVSFLAGVPLSAGAVTVNRFCASSLETINQVASAIMCGNGDVFIAGGVESMSHIPMGGFNPSLNERLMRPEAPMAYIGMGETAENLARKYSISREEQDAFALASHRKAIKAMKDGKFKCEIVPIKKGHVAGEDGPAAADGCPMLEHDEGPREDTSMEKLAQLKPAFMANGTVTAGNSSQMTDGVAITVLMSERLAKKLKIRPLARIVSTAVAGCDPATMGEGPIFAVPKALKRAGMKLGDVDLIELNEAFAAQSLAVIGRLGLDEKKVNVHGGAIALGHPLGATGARIMATLLHSLVAYDKEIGLETMCVGGGQGLATIVERM